jgi:transposase
MLGPPPGTRVFLACGVTDMRRGFDGLAAQVQTVLAQDPYGGAMFCFRGRRGDLLKILLWDGQGLILLAKRLEKGRFVTPRSQCCARCWPNATLSCAMRVSRLKS